MGKKQIQTTLSNNTEQEKTRGFSPKGHRTLFTLAVLGAEGQMRLTHLNYFRSIEVQANA